MNQALSKLSTAYLLIPALLLVFLLNLSLGAIRIPFKEVLMILTGDESVKSTWRYIVWEYRFPKAIVAVLVGAALSVSGLLMQTLFRNPMAGPYVLGLTSGASLGVAIVVLGAGLLPVVVQGFFVGTAGIVLASIAGSFGILILVLLLSRRVTDSMTLLIVGLMFGSFASAIVGVLTYFGTAEQLKKYTFWALGSLGNLTETAVWVFALAVAIGLFISVFSIKALDALLLGERYAASLGIEVKRARFWIILATSILAGASTAFAGPIAFVGLAVPHMARLFIKSSKHKSLLVSSAFMGAILMLLCDAVTQFPGRAFVLPINAVTSLVGAPIVIWLLLKR